jgi:hypothetical protein
LTTVNTFNPESFVPEVTILAIRWTSQPPSGLPYHQGATAAESKPAAIPTPAETAPATPPPAAPEKKDETPKAEESNTNSVPIPPTTNFEPGNTSGQ